MLKTVVTCMRVKYEQYWKELPLFYCFAFILNSRFKLERFYDTLRILGLCLGHNYIEKFYEEVETKFHSTYASNEEQWCDEKTEE